MILSDLDKRILSTLQRDASMSMADLATEVSASSATCWRRVKALEEAGVLGPQVRLVDHKAVDRPIDAFCQIKLTQQNVETRAAFQRAVEQEPAIIEVYSTSGEWDYLMHLLVQDIADLEQTLMRRVLELSSVAATSTTFALRRIKHTTAVPL
jgi:Lrp/AsnC family transcriptional regulator